MDSYYLGLRFLNPLLHHHAQYFILIGYVPSLSQGPVFWLLGAVVQCGVPMYVQLGGKGCSLSMAIEIPLASKLGTSRYFIPMPHAIRSHNLWLIISMVLLQKLYNYQNNHHHWMAIDK